MKKLTLIELTTGIIAMAGVAVVVASITYRVADLVLSRIVCLIDIVL